MVVHKDVVGLDVAVDDALFVGGLQAAARGPELLDDGGPGSTLLGEPARERPAGLVFHDEKRSRAVGTCLVDADHVRVSESGQRLGLSHQSAVLHVEDRPVAGADQLQSDPTVELGIVDGVDIALTAAANALKHRESVDCSARRKWIEGGPVPMPCVARRIVGEPQVPEGLVELRLDVALGCRLVERAGHGCREVA